MQGKLFDSERRVLECLWERGGLPAKELAALLAAQVGWSKTTTYTVIKKCIDKGAVERRDPGFLCRALVSREQVLEEETEAFLDRNYRGSADLLVASLLGRKKLSGQELSHLKQIISELE